MRPLLDVVIVNWNAGDQLRDCLASLAASGDAARLRVVVVDNASTDGTPDLVREHFAHVQLLTLSHNGGGAGCCCGACCGVC